MRPIWKGMRLACFMLIGAPVAHADITWTTAGKNYACTRPYDFGAGRGLSPHEWRERRDRFCVILPKDRPVEVLGLLLFQGLTKFRAQFEKHSFTLYAPFDEIVPKGGQNRIFGSLATPLPKGTARVIPTGTVICNSVAYMEMLLQGIFKGGGRRYFRAIQPRPCRRSSADFIVTVGDSRVITQIYPGPEGPAIHLLVHRVTMTVRARTISGWVYAGHLRELTPFEKLRHSPQNRRSR